MDISDYVFEVYDFQNQRVNSSSIPITNMSSNIRQSATKITDLNDLEAMI